MPRPKRWKEEGITDGVGLVTLYKWQYFHDFVYQQMLDYSAYIWRGQRCDSLELESTLDRLVRKERVAKNRQAAFRSRHLERFKYATRGRRGANPPAIDNENEWWALGQHHGLATPLLDWTESPFVSAFFAFVNTGDPQTDRRAIYALHRPSVEQKVAELYQQAVEQRTAEANAADAKNAMKAAVIRARPIRNEVEFIRPLSDENRRLVSQAGLFSRAPDGTSIEKWISSNFAGESQYYKLMKITVPNRDRENCLRSLNRMNINHLTLFPDLPGAARFCNQHCFIGQY